MISEVYQAAIQYLENGFSIVPARIAPEEINGRQYGAKTPIGRWKQYQSLPITKEVLYSQLEYRLDPAFAIICGRVSGNLEVIDIDEKHNPGGAAQYFTTLRDLYPGLYQKLRIHRTQSGGFHILYRCEELLEDGNRKLAVAQGRKEAWLETRGEGGYFLAPPSKGYTVQHNVPVPVLSMDERMQLINTAILFDTREIKLPRQHIRASNKESEKFSENPFEDFNKSDRGKYILSEFGWEVYKEDNHYVHFTRPGKGTGVSASYIKDKQVFKMFTTSTEFEGDKGYNPSTVLSILLHNGNKKETFQYLLSNGFGKLNPQFEQRFVENAARQAPEGILPAYISQEGKQHFEEEKHRLQEEYPLGIFWEGDSVNGFKISREAIYKVSEGLGFCLYRGTDLCRIEGNLLRKVDDRYYFDMIKSYIKEEGKTGELVRNAFEDFIQSRGAFTISRLPILNELRIIKSGKTVSFKFYRNCVVKITAQAIEQIPYAKLNPDNLIWSDTIQDRDFSPSPQGIYIDYLQKALVNYQSALPVIGYLAHEYRDETMGYIIVLTESVPNPMDGGGAGKNVFCNLLKLTTSYVSRPGSQTKLDEKVFQSWNGERVFGISDVPKNFDISFFKEPATGSFIYKKLYKDEVSVDVEEGPKFVIQTNFSYKVTDGGLARRIIPVEFTDFFTKAKGLDAHYNTHFPGGWSAQDYAGFDHIITTGIQKFIQAQCKLSPEQLTATGWQKQFDITYNEQYRQFLEENLESWLHKRNVPMVEFNESYGRFCQEMGIPAQYQLSATARGKGLTEFGKHNNIKVEVNKPIKNNGILVKYHCLEPLRKDFNYSSLVESLPKMIDMDDF